MKDKNQQLSDLKKKLDDFQDIIKQGEKLSDKQK